MRGITRLALPPNCPPAYVPGWTFDASAYGQLTDLLRTNGASYGGFADGHGLLAWGNEYTTYDARSVDGKGNNANLNPLYPWPGGAVNARMQGGNLVLEAGACADIGVGSVMRYRDTDTRHTLYGSELNTWDSLALKGDWLIRTRATLSSVTASWGALWLFNKIRNAITGAVFTFEVDLIEHAPSGFVGAQTWLSTNAHGSATAGGSHDSTNTETDTGVVIAGVERTFECRRQGDVLTWWMDGVFLRQLTIPSAWLGKDDWLYLRMDNNVGLGPGYPGTFVSGTSQMKIRSIEIFKPAATVASELICNWGINDGLGPDRVVGLPNTSGFTPGFFGNDGGGGSSADGTPKGGITPVVVTVTNGFFDRRNYSGKAATGNNGNAFNESGSTPANGGFVNGVTYRNQVLFEYGTSNNGYFQIQAPGGALTFGSFTGTTPSVFGGAIASPRFFNDSFGRTTFEFLWTADATGDSAIGIGPGSTTVGQNIVWYDLESRPLP